MSDREPPLELNELNSSKRTQPTSSSRGMLVGALLGSVSAFALFFLLKDQFGNPPAPQQQADNTAATENSSTSDSADVPNSNAEVADTQENSVSNNLNPKNVDPEQVDSENILTRNNSSSTTEKAIDDATLDSEELIESTIPVTPLLAEKPEANLIAAATQTSPTQPKSQSSSSNASSSAKTKEENKREDVKLSDRRWTTLVLFQKPVKGEAPIPENFPVWNFPKGYQFEGSKHDQHRLGNFRVDGEFIIRDGYLRREFGNTALLHLPAAQNFDLEGIASFEGIGGWLMLVGWNIETKSGYVIYNTKLRSNTSPWFAIEIKDGKPVPNTERVLVDRRVEGEGALRVRIEDKTISMQVADGYLFKDEKLPNYKEGHVAIGTYSPRYGPQNIGIKSLRMKLRK